MTSTDWENRVVLNVGGVRHETYKHVLKKIPATRLSKLTENLANYDATLKEYFFDRHPGVFAQVLNYYRTGKLHYPLSVCGPLFEEELQFWGLDANQVEPCCWMTYTQYKNTRETLVVLDQLDNRSVSEHELAKSFGWEDEYLSGNLSWWQKVKPQVWLLFDEPWSSKSAKIISYLAVFFICLSTVIFILKTHPIFLIPLLAPLDVDDDQNMSEFDLNHGVTKYDASSVPSLLYIDLMCNVWFTFELTTRFCFCPNKMNFIKDPLNCVDFFASVSTYIDVLYYFLENNGKNNDYVQFIGLTRILRLFRLAKHSSGLKLLAQTIKASAHELLLLAFVVLLGIVLYGALIFYAERMENNEDNHFDSIAHGLWWAIVTMSTIGYGDMVPKTYIGMVVGCFCALTGVLILSLPMPVIVSNFEMFYSHSQARAKLPKNRRQVLDPEQTKKMVKNPNNSVKPADAEFEVNIS